MARVALVTGITGQDGYYLTELLLSKGYQVHGLVRATSSSNIEHLAEQFQCCNCVNSDSLMLHNGDMTDSGSLTRLLYKIRPQEVYHLAAQSHVQVSFDLPAYTTAVDALGTLRLLEAIISSGLKDSVRFFQASSSDLFGSPSEIPQNEETPFYPKSIYGIGFVTRKITSAVAKIHVGLQDVLELGNLDSQRDWGYAQDYVMAMWLMLQADEPDDFVLASGTSHSVRQFVETAFRCADIGIRWEGEGVNEVGIDSSSNITRVRINSTFYRPSEETLVSYSRTRLHILAEFRRCWLVMLRKHEEFSIGTLQSRLRTWFQRWFKPIWLSGGLAQPLALLPNTAGGSSTSV